MDDNARTIRAIVSSYSSEEDFQKKVQPAEIDKLINLLSSTIEIKRGIGYKTIDEEEVLNNLLELKSTKLKKEGYNG
ncbi:MAG TPA: hypothetical protein PKA53_02095 [Sphingobacterium sp.]|nr:hypothetical protein [Sphingobacterium sp.]